ncbi:molecular chaperone TorD [Neisseria zalophi]|uniref:Molecular chaperone TorD n=1 Tax=Neisseria zalophi TaxID=640030 RepID=A0A5J6PSP7_9NEIS|nr:molecular chaperone TorD [Neisseria zalophi]QEY25768.1 molecular chaperone TorD [Neisseria zalophi]
MDTTINFKTTFPNVSAQRSSLYAWFADWLALERSNQDLEHYTQENASTLWQTLAACGLEQESQRFQTALSQALTLPDARLELAADFTTLFLLQADICATPYASWYLEENKRLYGDAELKMRQFLKENRLQLNKQFKEPADHLAVFLSLLSHWIAQTATTNQPEVEAKNQALFIREALLVWLPIWAKRTQQIMVKTDVYPALAALLVAFVEADANYLDEQ